MFEYDHTGYGFGFPCDENGNVLNDQMQPIAVQNYNECMAHPERFQIFNKVRRHKNTWRKPAEGDCVCGTHVILEDRYMGACSCPNCNRWYSISGQSLVDPEYWEE